MKGARMPDQKRVVAGYDGSPESKLAMQWAAEVAQRRGIGLRVVNATGVDPTTPAAYRAGVAIPTERGARAVAEEGAKIAREFANIDVEAVGIEHGAVKALVEQSETAELLVLGNRGRGRLRGVLLGSSAFSVAIHAKCPVSIIRHNLRPLPSPEFPIVVGTDGSESSAGAVMEAARLASETGATLKIVSAYAAPSNTPWLIAKYPPGTHEGDDPNVWERQVFDPDLDGTSSDQRRRGAANMARDAGDLVAEKYPNVPIELIVASGRPERVIVEAAEDASVIVVGARGRGDFASLLLGSVSRDVIQHADCAVYIVR